MTIVKDTPATVIPTLHYEDAPAAIEWLCGTFGFVRHAVYPGENGTIAHAELTLGNGMIMLASASKKEFGKYQKTPRGLGGTTQSAYIIVLSPDALHERAVKAGAEIVMPLSDKAYGGREFSCRDPQGHLWTFGTYDPWKKG